MYTSKKDRVRIYRVVCRRRPDLSVLNNPGGNKGHAHVLDNPTVCYPCLLILAIRYHVFLVSTELQAYREVGPAVEPPWPYLTALYRANDDKPPNHPILSHQRAES